MSMPDPLTVACPYCGSSPGFPCRKGTSSIFTARIVQPHASRKAAAAAE
jgi:hypothetical protein